MFARVTTVNTSKGKYQYLQILQSYHHQGRCKHRVVANLGRVDLLSDKLDRLVGSLGKYCKNKFLAPNQIECKQALPWGPVLVARYLWEQINLGEIIHKHCQSHRHKFDVAETAFVLVANRLCEPGSEHGLARWLEHTFVCDSRGNRWQPDWIPAERVSKNQRVKVEHKQLNRWYRTLDALLASKEEIEKALYLCVRDLFNVKVDMVFYDLTSTYFCRKSPKGRLRRHGKSKDKKPRQVQVVVGVVMANGFPIAHHVFEGNTADKSTLQKVAGDLERRFGLRRVIVVTDRGLVSPENLDFLTKRHYGYLVGVQGRRCDEAADVLKALDKDKWQQIDEKNNLQEVSLSNSKVRYFVIDSTERRSYEQSLRERSMERTKQELQRIADAVNSGRLKDPSKIGARAGRALFRNHGHRYYSWNVSKPGHFDFYQDQEKLESEKLHEGKYILKTDNRKLDPTEAVSCYKELNTVEQCFRDLKDVIDMRPIHHKTDERVEAHIFVASLALFLKRTLEHQLSSKLPEISGTDALSAMKSVGVAELNFNGQTKRLVSAGGRDARRILTALGIKKINPESNSKQAYDSEKTAT